MERLMHVENCTAEWKLRNERICSRTSLEVSSSMLVPRAEELMLLDFILSWRNILALLEYAVTGFLNDLFQSQWKVIERAIREVFLKMNWIRSEFFAQGFSSSSVFAVDVWSVKRAFLLIDTGCHEDSQCHWKKEDLSEHAWRLPYWCNHIHITSNITIYIIEF